LALRVAGWMSFRRLRLRAMAQPEKGPRTRPFFVSRYFLDVIGVVWNEPVCWFSNGLSSIFYSRRS